MENKKEQNYAGSENIPHINKGKGFNGKEAHAQCKGSSLINPSESSKHWRLTS
jgi:hypothetical protein